MRPSFLRSTSTQRPRRSCKPSPAGQQRLDLGSAEPLAVERDLHAEVQQRILSQQRRRSCADAGLDQRAGGTAGLPRPRRAHNDAGSLQLRYVAEELIGIGGQPAQRVIDLAGFHHRAQPSALLRRALHRHQQGKQPRLTLSVRELGQRPGKRQVLRLAVGRDARGVGGEKGERRLRVLAVLREIEMDPANQIPDRMTCLEKFLERAFRCDKFIAQGGIEIGPKRGQHFGRQILHARHRRGIGDQGIESLVVGCGRRRRPRAWRTTLSRSARQNHATRPRRAAECSRLQRPRDAAGHAPEPRANASLRRWASAAGKGGASESGTNRRWPCGVSSGTRKSVAAIDMPGHSTEYDVCRPCSVRLPIGICSSRLP